MGPQPLLHPRLLPVARQTHLPLGQTPDQALRLVGRCIYARRASIETQLYKLAFHQHDQTNKCKYYLILPSPIYENVNGVSGYDRFNDG